MTGYDLSLRPYHFKDEHNFLSDPTCNKNDPCCIFVKKYIKHFQSTQTNVPYSPNGKRNIRDPFKENIDSSRTVAMIQRPVGHTADYFS
jgi:hypothetical protein